MRRVSENPVLNPDLDHEWESVAAFNGSVIINDIDFHIFYRAMSHAQDYKNITMQLSTIGHGSGIDGVHFTERNQIIVPDQDWDQFGCEDPRITKVDDTYYIFYTALSGVPFNAQTIKIGVAISKDLNNFKEKHLVTPFNAKAMALFPRKINNKFAAFLTVNTDNPPSKIAFATFDKQEDIWSQDFWNDWHKHLDSHVIYLQRSKNDHVEAGTPPIYTDQGWLLFYSYIKNYFTPRKKFTIEAVLLDLENPQHVIGRIEEPLLMPEAHYELYGNVPNIVFPTGALIYRDQLYLYYGAADTTCCLATANIKSLFSKIKIFNTRNIRLKRFNDNPIIRPKLDHAWEAKAVFNPAAFYEAGKVHIVYRAMSNDGTSTLGYASSSDGFHIDERLFEPIYIPHESFEHKKKLGNSGCEDPRITKIDDKFYMLYTAFDGENPPRVAMTSIKVDDFLNKRWYWEKPVLISPPGIDDKDACIFPEKINGKYVIFHRIIPDIVVDFEDSLNFDGKTWLKVEGYISPRNDYWDNERIGICGLPIKTDKGWLLLYHGISNIDYKYRVGALLLKLDDPRVVLARSDSAIFGPDMIYERVGQTKNVVFPCGNVVINDEIFVYYGAADSVVGVATVKLQELLDSLV